MGKKLSYENVKQFIEVDSGSGCKLLSTEYVNGKSKLKIQCKCGNVFEKSWSKFSQKTQPQQICKECGKKNLGDKNGRKSTEFFKQEVHELFNGEYEILGEYVNNSTKIKIKHVKCGHVYMTAPSNFLGKNGKTNGYTKLVKTCKYLTYCTGSQVFLRRNRLA